MARNVSLSSAKGPAARQLQPKQIALTLRECSPSQPVQSVNVLLSELIAYSDQFGFTRLNVTGRKVLEVKERTWEIDWLVRAAASQNQWLAE